MIRNQTADRTERGSAYRDHTCLLRRPRVGTALGRTKQRTASVLPGVLLSAFVAIQPLTAQSSAPANKRSMTVADLLALEAVNAAAVDDSGSAVAIVVERARRPGEPIAGEGLYGGNVRGDVIVFSAASGQVLFRTSGAAERVGYWHPSWAPGGRRLAMLSLRGDTLTACIWHRDSGTLTCLPGDRSLDYLTQLSVGMNPAPTGRSINPFLWLSDSILALGVLPAGELDGAAVRSHALADSIAVTWAREQNGQEATASALDTPMPVTSRPASAELRIVNVVRGTTRATFRVPYFSGGWRCIVLSPDHAHASILAEQYQPLRNAMIPFGFHNRMHTALGLAHLERDTAVWWVPSRPYTRFARWSPDGHRLGIMVKGTDDENVTRGARLFVVDATTRIVDSLMVDSVSDRELRWTSGDGFAVPRPTFVGPADHVLAVAPRGAFAIVRRNSSRETSVWQVPAKRGPARRLVSLNAHIAGIADASRMLITYSARDGSEQRGVVLLPPEFSPGSRYPLVTWVYPGMTYTDTLDGQWLRKKDDPSPFNPNLLTGHGYAVLFPSMPLLPDGVAGEPCSRMLDGIDAALDTLIARGMVDSARLGVLGQSYGGYGVNCIASQSRRFRAAVSLAGISNLSSFALQLATASRYTESPTFWLPWAETGQGRMGGPPWRDADRYVRNSPITHVDSVRMPVLLTGGDGDYVEQAEEWFTALHRAGKRARFVRYWGGEHTLYSPANITHLWGEILAWLDTYLPPQRGKPRESRPVPSRR